MSLRRLTFLVVETGKCLNCGRDAGMHSIEGLCGPQSMNQHDTPPDVPRPCYAGFREFAYVDLDKPRDMGELAAVLT